MLFGAVLRDQEDAQSAEGWMSVALPSAHGSRESHTPCQLNDQTLHAMQSELRLHPLTLQCSLPAVEQQIRGDSFKASYVAIVIAFSAILGFHLVSGVATGFSESNKISTLGCLVFLALRWSLHQMPDQSHAHAVFSLGSASILVLGHVAFVWGQWTDPKSVDGIEAAGTACIWIVIGILQHLLLMDKMHTYSVTGAIALANFLCEGWSVLPRSTENMLVAAALGTGSAMGYATEHMIRSSYLIQLLRERLAHEERDLANAAAARFERGCTYLSHEIRNQLFPYSQIIQHRDFSDDNVIMMENSLVAVTHVLDSVLQVAKLHAEGTLYAQRAWFPLERLSKATNLYGKCAAKTRGVDFRVELDSLSQSNVEVYGDEHLLCQALTNLLSNACKFTPPGTGVVTLRGMTVALLGTVEGSTTRPDGDEPSAEGGRVRCTWTVEDNGDGIAPDNIEHVFQAFGQVRSCASSGTGLGLPLTKAMVEEAHGGSMALTSQVDAGTCINITVDLPCREPSAVVEDGGETHDAAVSTSPRALALKRPARVGDLAAIMRDKYGGFVSSSDIDCDVLVCDDSKMNRMVIKWRCEKSLLSCEMANDGAQAIAAIYPTMRVHRRGGRQQGTPVLTRCSNPTPRNFGIILLDMHMPMLTGKETCRTLRELGYGGPIALLSGVDATAEARVDLLASGFDFILCKGERPDFSDLLAAYSQSRESINRALT